MEGTVAAARDIGADAGALATQAAEGAIEAADRIGAAAGRTVRDALSGTIAGIKIVVGEALPERGRTTSPPRGSRKPARKPAAR